jgi:signal transduction histidine kinase
MTSPHPHHLSPRRTLRARRLARKLVELSRLERGLERAELAEIELPTLLLAVCGDYPGVRLEGASSKPILSDSPRLAAILFALLDNAHVHGGAPISVQFDEQAITIIDNGPGLAEDLLARATGRFVRGAGARGGGAGLGLTLASEQARLIGASLGLLNDPRGGARVTIALSQAATTSEPVLRESFAGVCH